MKGEGWGEREGFMLEIMSLKKWINTYPTGIMEGWIPNWSVDTLVIIIGMKEENLITNSLRRHMEHGEDGRVSLNLPTSIALSGIMSCHLLMKNTRSFTWKS